MKKLNVFGFLVFALLQNSCQKDFVSSNELKTQKVGVLGHPLATFFTNTSSNNLVVFESGLGDNHSVWLKRKVANKIALQSDVILYDRAGYGESRSDDSKRSIQNLTKDLESVISALSQNRKVILVGHSLGGMIIRDYAIKYPEKIAALVFVDSSHEAYNRLTQDQENMLVETFSDSFGETSGAAAEAKELIENSVYMETLPHLPDVPVVAITSMKTDANHDEADRAKWYNSKELLKEGVRDFHHITTTQSGHYIMLDEPDLVIAQVMKIISKF